SGSSVTTPYTFLENAAHWSDKIFGTSDKGKLNHYLNEVSYGNFQFTKAIETQGVVNDGIITVILDQNHPDTRNVGDIEPLLKTALAAADAFIDFASYDTGPKSPVFGENRIEKDELQIMFLIAGGEAATSAYPGVWAHASAINGVVHDGVKVMSGTTGTTSSGVTTWYPETYGGYSVFGERWGSVDIIDSNYSEATIGVIAHELGHALWRLPDLYDIDASSAGIGNFGLMGSGSYGYTSGEKKGTSPAHPTAWSKTRMGFVSAEVVTDTVTAKAVLATDNASYKPLKIMTDRAEEYFLIENRSTTGYDAGLYPIMPRDASGVRSDFSGGMAIWHIDENQFIPDREPRWPDNRDETHKAVDLEEATLGGLDAKTNRGRLENLFYQGNITSFTSLTTPNSNQYDETSSGLSVTNIGAPSDSMSCDINFN
ncbi:MAG TPA: M6 family metalloprotease domain-containing protein, partial [Leucothrix sp.]|nr:M6 family metalloprotease domain-containing protein [Leucothrix sp.]